MRRLFWAACIVAGTAAFGAGALWIAVLEASKASTHDTEEVLWPDVMERQSTRLQILSGHIRGYAAAHSGLLPPGLGVFMLSFSHDERPSVARLLVDVWGMPVEYEPVGAVFNVRSAGPDRTWSTPDDLSETAGTDFDPRPRRREYDSVFSYRHPLHAGAGNAGPTRGASPVARRGPTAR